MADDCPPKSDIESVFKRLRSIPANKICFDCNAKNPTWASVTYGVFICIDCSAVHRGLGVHLSFVRSTQLDTHWTWTQIRNMQLGGNANASTFFRQHNCDTTDAQVKYNSRAATLYRDKLDHASKQAMKLHGTKLFIDGGLPHESHHGEEKKDSDFFDSIMQPGEESTNGFQTNFPTQPRVDPTPVRSVPTLAPANPPEPVKVANNLNSTSNSNAHGSPSVEGAFSSNSATSLSEHKSTIGRKGPAKRTGLGAKKAGLGAQKVKANFAEIEREAELADQLKESIENSKKNQAAAVQQSTEEQDAKMASMRLAYQDLSLQQKKEEEKLKITDPKKAEQIERLGMGFCARGEIQHSALSDMKIIKQETPIKSKSSSSSDDPFVIPFSFIKKVEQFSDSDLDFILRSGSSNWMDSEPKSTSAWDKSSNDMDSMWKDNLSSKSSPPKSSSNNWEKSNNTWEKSSNNWEKSSNNWEKPSNNWEKSSNDWDNTSSNWNKSSSNWDKTETSKNTASAPSSKQKAPASAAPKTADTGSDAQKKFGAAKSISSAQYFGDSTEEKCNLSRFEGSTSISSAELFGGGSSHQDYAAGYTPDLDDVKESLRQGATKVAGKLSSLANGVMSSIQEKYSGGY
ncbi:unnamed protein product [Bemisia tabaci]|uniref:Arf-GAP domain-containing protein n=1 Tax=Bemisia tabaci TaxID=7038 RepID=A0A9P0AQF1_BEMTA|nr:unnamed protein product [Bemisia tabaci]